jgi:superfamily I DNA and RNA helicase
MSDEIMTKEEIIETLEEDSEDFDDIIVIGRDDSSVTTFSNIRSGLTELGLLQLVIDVTLDQMTGADNE